MKTFTRLALCVLLSATSFATFAQSQSWMLFNGTEAFTASAIVQLPDESVVLAGTSIGAADSAYYYYSSTTFTVTRISKYGDVMWAKKIEGFNYYNTTGSTLFYGNDALYVGFSTFDSLSYSYSQGLMKLDLNGNQLACKTEAADIYNYNYSVNRFGQLPNGNIVMMKSVMSDFEVICFDQNLDVQWARSIDPDSGVYKDPGLSLDVEDSCIVICGKSDNRIAYTMLTPEGDFIGGYRFDNSALYLQARNVFKVGDGLIMQGLLIDYYSMSGYYCGFVCKTDLQGNMLWFKKIQDNLNSSYDFIITDAKVTSEGHFIYTGTTGLGGNACGELDQDGNIVWSRVSSGGSYSYYNAPFAFNGTAAVVLIHGEDVYPYGNLDHLTFTSLDVLKSGDVCGYQSSEVVTSNVSFDYTTYPLTAGNVGNLNVTFNTSTVGLTDVTADFTTIEACETVNGIVEVVAGQVFSLSPNPTNDNLVVAYNGKPAGLKIYNSVGALVMEQNINGGNTNFNVSSLSSGVYMVTLADGHQVVSQKFVVQR
jgi:hypothetical protein